MTVHCIFRYHYHLNENKLLLIYIELLLLNKAGFTDPGKTWEKKRKLEENHGKSGETRENQGTFSVA